MKAGRKYKTTEQFIAQAKEVHGEFNQIASNHLRGDNCPKHRKK